MLAMTLSLYQLNKFAEGFHIGAEDPPEDIKVAVEGARARIKDSLARIKGNPIVLDDAWHVMLSMEPEEMQAARCCFEVGAEGTDEISDTDYREIMEALVQACGTPGPGSPGLR